MKLLRHQVDALAMSGTTPKSVATFVQKKVLRRIPGPHRDGIDAFVHSCACWSRQKHSFYHERDLVQHLCLLFSVSPEYDEHPDVKRWLGMRQPHAGPCIDAMLEELPDEVWSEVETNRNPASWARLIRSCRGAAEDAATERLAGLLSTHLARPASPDSAAAAARARRSAHRGAEWDLYEAIEPCKLGIPRWIFSW
ncbi:hypothetical protein ACOXH8_26970 [Nannocystis pusilla]